MKIIVVLALVLLFILDKSPKKYKMKSPSRNWTAEEILKREG